MIEGWCMKIRRLLRALDVNKVSAGRIMLSYIDSRGCGHLLAEGEIFFRMGDHGRDARATIAFSIA